jgi:hypothetical protein
MNLPGSPNPHLPSAAVPGGKAGSDAAHRANRNVMLLRALCVVLLLGILTAGLWPFHAPHNEVSWLAHGNGVFFGKYGSMVSAGPFKAGESEPDGASLEIWLQPSDVDDGGTVLSFYTPENRIIPFALRQSMGDLELERVPQGISARKDTIYFHNIFTDQKPELLAVTSGKSGTAIYVDGALVTKSADFNFSSRDLIGQLVVSNSPVSPDSWSGKLMGLAIYHRDLTAAEVSGDYEEWRKTGQTSVAAHEGVVAHYAFSEGTGNVVHNQLNSATDLVIPGTFFMVHEKFLETPWDGFYSGWHYWKNIAINIAGFIPVGFFLYAYFYWLRSQRRRMASTIALGFAISLTIEVLQALLPTRDSGMTDLITNTLGTAIGAVMYTNAAIQAIIAKTVFHAVLYPKAAADCASEQTLAGVVSPQNDRESKETYVV